MINGSWFFMTIYHKNSLSWELFKIDPITIQNQAIGNEVFKFSVAYLVQLGIKSSQKEQ
mgnify:CR=1 FL=1